MARLIEKIVLGIFVVLFVGFGAVFLNAQFQGEAPATGKATQAVPAKEISIDEAKAIAQSIVEGEVVNVEKEDDEWFPAYEVTLQYGNTFVEVEIHARTGEILDIETGEEGKEEEVDPQQVTTLGGRVTQEQAVAIALAEIPGATHVSTEAEREGGILLYGVKLKRGSDTVEVEIDAATGAIVEIEWNDD